ncbi:MAG: hypothetical protein CL920_38045 [Deltaproteobacteria bacterium]|nr:hypothetical protein [Deltaproteobacteria bacterium]
MIRFSSQQMLRWCLGVCVLVFAIPSAHAQLDIFEKPKNNPPPQRRGFTFGTFKVGGNSGRKQMNQGQRLYAQGNYQAASLKFFLVVSQMSGSRWFQTAEFQLAKCLYRMGLYHAALDYFTGIIRTGASHRHFRSSLSWVILISRRLKNESMFLGKLKRFRTADFPRKYRNELFYLLGKYYFQNKKLPLARRLKLALKLLLQVQSRQAKFYARAQYVIGVIYALANQANNAARAFRLAATSARRIKNKKMQRNILELSVLALARIHYGAKHFKAAISYYRLIERKSGRWLDVLFERAWAHLRRGQYGHTLGILHSLDSPYFRNEYFPEVGILRAVSFFERCRYKRVKKIITTYLRRYRPLVSSINSFLTRNPSPQRAYITLRNLRNQESASGLDDDPSAQMFQRLLKLTFKDKKVRLLFDYIKEITRELQVIQQSRSLWRGSALGRLLQKRLKQERMAKVSEAGSRAQSRFRAAKNELAELISQALKIQYETLGAEKALLQASASQQGSFTMKSSRRRKRNRITVAAPDDYVFWPFQGEYWVDELGFYRYRVRGECKK